MAADLTFQPISIATRSVDDEARLVLIDGRLVGVLVLLQDELHAELRGHWMLDAAFGDFEDDLHETFTSLEDAARWFSRGTDYG